MMVALHLMVALHFKIRIISVDNVSLLGLVSLENFPPMCTKCILAGVGWLLNKLDGTLFIGGRKRQTVRGVDAPIKIFILLELEINFSCGCIIWCFLSNLFLLSTIFIPECAIRFNAVVGVSKTHTMYNLFELIGYGVSIHWKEMWTFYLWCCNNVWFFVLEKVSFIS